ncbi:MAG: phosphatase PAP2 family protein [Prevotellaceae bacterium]|jgi:undecaprenyl-diphosphatase|nr:phosphatase PAP2 family protein [Prevotellaceae bacterium]
MFMSNTGFPEWDTELFLIINGFHFDWLDPVMKTFSDIYLWIPMYLGIAGFMFRGTPVWKSILMIALLGATFAMSDQLSVHLFKNVFERLRPCHVDELKPLIHSLEHCGGQYGFISNHAANAFCFAMFTAWFFKNRYFTVWIFFWAVCVAYSRIYVGKHFPLDVVCGATFGIVCQQIILMLYKCGVKILEMKTQR